MANTGFSLGDIVTVGSLAWTVYKACSSATSEFQEVAREVVSLHSAVKQLEAEASKPDSVLQRAIDSKRKELDALLQNIEQVLKHLDGLVSKYKSLNTNNRKKRDILRFSSEGLDDVRSKIILHTTATNLFIGTLSAASLGRIEVKLDEIVNELRNGQRNTAAIAVSDDEDDPAAVKQWRTLSKELVDDGFRKEDIENHKAWIKAEMRQRVAKGQYEQEKSRSSIEPTPSQFSLRSLSERDSFASTSNAGAAAGQARKSALTGLFGDAFKPFEQGLPNNEKEEPNLILPVNGCEYYRTSALDLLDYDSIDERDDPPPGIRPGLDGFRQLVERSTLRGEDKKVDAAANEYRTRTAAEGSGGAPPSSKASTIQKHFGNSEFKNLPVLEKANQDVVQKFGEDAISSTTHGMTGASQSHQADDSDDDYYGLPKLRRSPSMSSMSSTHSEVSEYDIYGNLTKKTVVTTTTTYYSVSASEGSAASERAMSIDSPNPGTLPRPSGDPGGSFPPALQSMMGQFSSKVSSSLQKKYKCRICDKRFMRAISLQTHMYSHTGEKAISCDFVCCGRHFSVVSNLRRHRKVHHGEGRDQPSPYRTD